MKAIILAAGFATRLYPLTLNKPKPLLEIKGKTIIDFTLEKLSEINDIRETIVVSNNKFYNHFVEWAKRRKNTRIINDRVNSDEEKLGAVGDLLFALNNENINEDIFIASGDNFFKFSLEKPYEVFRKENKDLSIFYDVLNLEDVKRLGVALVKNNLLVDFEEKPQNPKSTLCSACMYFFRKETIPLIRDYGKEATKKDNPGDLLNYLYKIIPIYIYIAPESNIDIGTKKALEQAQKI